MTLVPPAHGVIDCLEVVLIYVVKLTFRALTDLFGHFEQKMEKKVSSLIGMKRKLMVLVML